MILAQACTGQKPAELKNSTTPRHPVKASCSNMLFEGQVLSKKNLLNILDCSGWAKMYPDLSLAFAQADENQFNQALKVVNDSFFNSKENRKLFYETIAEAESRGELDSLEDILQKTLSDHQILAQVDNALNKNHMNLTERADFMKVLSTTNDQNLKIIRTIKHIAQAFERQKTTIHGLLSAQEKAGLVSKVANLLNDFSNKMDATSWGHLSKVIFSDNSSPMQRWAVEGQGKDLNLLLNIVEEPDFFQDVNFLHNSLETGIVCTNRASSQDFKINVAQELKQKIDGLKNNSRHEFQQMLLHGLTKYLAFQEFCEESSRQQGLQSFFKVLKHAFTVLPSNHDYRFLKKIHQIFGTDRYVFLSFLSSNSFSSLRELLINLQAGGGDAEFVSALYDMLADLSEKDMEIASEVLSELSESTSKTAVWQKSWSKLWDGLTRNEKENFIRLMGIFLSEESRPSATLNLLETLLGRFPDFSGNLAQNLSQETFQNNLRYLIHVLSQNKVQSDLSRFLSNKGVFEFIAILTQEYQKPVPQAQALETVNHGPAPYVADLETLSSLNTKSCFNELSTTYEQDASYYNLVNSLPETCLNVLGEVGFVGQIYLWMNSSEKYFRARGIDDFHSGTGVWAPGMLQFIFSAAVKADFALLSSSGKKGILENIDQIHANLVDERLLETIHQFSNLYQQVDKKLPGGIEVRLLNFVENKDDQSLNEITADSLILLGNSTPVISLKASSVKCSDLSSDYGVSSCLDSGEVKNRLLDMVRILKRPNEKNVTLAKEFVKFVHPAGGVSLPFAKKTTHTHTTSLDEVIRFLNDLSSPQTSQKFHYVTSDRTKLVTGTVLDRLEIVIRDISFNNNFYGAYFKNDVAGAKDYRKDVLKSEKLLSMLERSGGLFRSLGEMPKESKHRLRNVKSTYSSLVEVSDEYLQADGTIRSYGPFIQSVLAMVSNSSKLKTQEFNPYRLPNEKIVEGHNGWFLTKTVELSALRHMAAFVRSRFTEDLSALDSPIFKKINNHLIARHDLVKLQNSAQRMLDSYFDNDRNQMNLMLEDGVDFFNSLTPQEQTILEEIGVKVLLLLSDERVSTENIEKAAVLIEVTTKMWPELRKVLIGVKDRRLDFLHVLNDFMNNLVEHPAEVNRLISAIANSNLISSGDLELMLQNDEVFIRQLSSFMNQLILLRDMPSDLNWFETISAILSQDTFEWESLKSWFKVALRGDKQKLSVSVLVEILGEKQPQGYKFKMIMDELFLNHRDQLSIFLEETFRSLELKPE